MYLMISSYYRVNMDKFNEIQCIAITLGLVNELFETKVSKNVSIAQKYMNILQDNGCKLRLIDGYIRLIDYNPKFMVLSKL